MAPGWSRRGGEGKAGDLQVTQLPRGRGQWTVATSHTPLSFLTLFYSTVAADTHSAKWASVRGGHCFPAGRFCQELDLFTSGTDTR